jgi:hypothetical protein
MNTERRPESIGAELIEASRNLDVSSLPLSTRLFPYIFVAARRMSLRTMSTWLQEKHGVSLSPAAISRALASPQMHLDRLAQSIAAPARYVAAAYGFEPMALLYDTVVENGPSELEILAKEHPQPDGEDDSFRWSELQDLASIWAPMPHEIQLNLRPYLESELGDPDAVNDQSNDNDF